MHRWALRFNRERMFQFHRPKGELHIMTRHVAEDAVAKIPPMTPNFGKIIRVVRPSWGWAEPKIPVKIRRNRRHAGRALAIRQTPVAPDVTLAHCANRARLHQLDDAAIV